MVLIRTLAAYPASVTLAISQSITCVLYALSIATGTGVPASAINNTLEYQANASGSTVLFVLAVLTTMDWEYVFA